MSLAKNAMPRWEIDVLSTKWKGLELLLQSLHGLAEDSKLSHAIVVELDEFLDKKVDSQNAYKAYDCGFGNNYRRKS